MLESRSDRTAPRAIQIAPSVLASDVARLGEQAEELSRIPGVDRIHVDVMDGRFVPNITFGPLVVEALRRHTSLPLDVHLMILEPSRYYSDFAAAGASALTVHVEACPHLYRDLTAIRALGLRAGVTLNPGTPATALDAALDVADQVLVMTVNPGFGGQAFIPSMIDKVAQVRRALDGRGLGTVDVMVDGGIAEETAPRVVEAGANVLIAGSWLFRHVAGLTEAVRRLRESVGG